MNPEKAAIDHIVVDNFHPKWHAINKSLFDVGMFYSMLHLAHSKKEFYGVPGVLNVDVMPNSGLTCLEFEDGSGLFLDEKARRYSTVGVGACDTGKVGVITSVLNEYLEQVKVAMHYHSMSEEELK